MFPHCFEITDHDGGYSAVHAATGTIDDCDGVTIDVAFGSGHGGRAVVCVSVRGDVADVRYVSSYPETMVAIKEDVRNGTWRRLYTLLWDRIAREMTGEQLRRLLATEHERGRRAGRAQLQAQFHSLLLRAE